MKNIFILGVIVTACLLPDTVSAATINTEAKPFDVTLAGISKSGDSDSSRFDFNIVDIQNKHDIAYWKVRVWCDEGVAVSVNSTTTNSCGSAVDMWASQDTFNLTFNNVADMPAGFFFKLKAYDQEGKWIHSEKRSFQWN